MKRIIVAAAIPTDDEGAPLPGFVRVGTTSGGDLILDCEERAQAPGGATVLSEGPPATRYDRTALGTHADRVLECRWERTVDGETERGREKRSAALSRNPTVTITEDNLVPHVWLGEAP